MAMLEVHFQGWFQCRLATDPDPFDEPRGVSGWTFAVAGEPDLDRVIRFQDPVAPRPFVGLQPGVRITSVVGSPAGSANPLVGGKVHLLDQPQFEGRNGLIADGGRELIVPFHLHVTTPDNVGPVTFQRRDPLDPDDHDVIHLSPGNRKRRQGRKASLSEAGIPSGVLPENPDQVYQKRLEKLQERWEPPDTEEVFKAALGTRIWGFKNLLGTYLFMRGHWVQWSFDVGQHGGRGTVDDPDDLLGGTVDTKAPWPLTLNMGAWDADALSGFAIGILRLPFMPST